MPRDFVAGQSQVGVRGGNLSPADYLSRSSGAWRSEVGTSLTPKWPTGIGGTGNEGVASYVQKNPLRNRLCRVHLLA